MTTCASLELGTLLRRLPDDFRDPHKLREIQSAFRLGYANPLWSKRDAVRLAAEAAMQSSCSRGKGYKAGKRSALLATATAERIALISERMSYLHRQRLADERAEIWSEGRTSKHQQAYLAMCPHE